MVVKSSSLEEPFEKLLSNIFRELECANFNSYKHQNFQKVQETSNRGYTLEDRGYCEGMGVPIKFDFMTSPFIYLHVHA